MGDVHPYGNPHFWFTPENVKTAVSNITDGLVRVAPEHRDYFLERQASYDREIEEAFNRSREALRPFLGTKILQYHESWSYFCEAMGLEVAGSVEPKPGIPPSGAQLARLVRQIKDEHVPLLLVEPYYPEKPVRFLQSHTGIRPLRLHLLLCGAEEHISYLQNLEAMVDEIVAALSEQRGAKRDAGSDLNPE